MKKKAVFLDRDGTVNIDRNYLFKTSGFEFEKNAVEGLKYLYEKGYLLIVISNQSGIARGYFTRKDVDKLHEYMKKMCRDNGFEISDFYYCPHHPDGRIKKYSLKCGCRKPGTELIEKAVEEHDIDSSLSYMIGDKCSDIEAGNNAGLVTVLVGTGYGSETRKECTGYDHYIDDLSECSKFIR